MEDGEAAPRGTVCCAPVEAFPCRTAIEACDPILAFLVRPPMGVSDSIEFTSLV